MCSWNMPSLAPEDILVQITAVNRGPEAAELHLLPTLWFRNNWSSWLAQPAEKPGLKQVAGPAGVSTVAATHPELGTYNLYCAGEVSSLIFTENETNNERLFPDTPNDSPYVKDAFDNYLVHGQAAAVNPDRRGTKVAAHYHQTVAPGESATVRLRLSPADAGKPAVGNPVAGVTDPFADFDAMFTRRQAEADEFYRVRDPAGHLSGRGRRHAPGPCRHALE